MSSGEPSNHEDDEIVRAGVEASLKWTQQTQALRLQVFEEGQAKASAGYAGAMRYSELLRTLALQGDSNALGMLVELASATISDLQIIEKEAIAQGMESTDLKEAATLFASIRSRAGNLSKWPILLGHTATDVNLAASNLAQIGLARERPEFGRKLPKKTAQSVVVEMGIQAVSVARLFGDLQIGPLKDQPSEWCLAIWQWVEHQGWLAPDGFPDLWKVGAPRKWKSSTNRDSDIVDGIRTAIIRNFEARFGVTVDRSIFPRRPYLKRASKPKKQKPKKTSAASEKRMVEEGFAKFVERRPEMKRQRRKPRRKKF